MMRRVVCMMAAASAGGILVAAGPALGATYTVTKTSDPAPVICLSGLDCSLREAIEDAEASAAADTIIVPPGAYDLIGGRGRFSTLTHPLTITGAGAQQTTIRMPTMPAASGSGPAAGFLASAGAGLTVTDLAIEDASIGVSSGPQVIAGAIAVDGADLTLERVALRRSQYVGSNQGEVQAGAVAVRGAGAGAVPRVVIRDAAIEDGVNSNNVSDSSAGGAGALRAVGADVVIERSSLTGNQATGRVRVAGALLAVGGSLAVRNTTISGNRAFGVTPEDGSGSSGGLRAIGTAPTLEHVTITGNASPSSDSSGGGIRADAATIGNSIIAGNSGSDCAINSLTSLGGNLGGSASCQVLPPADLVGVDPKLGPLEPVAGSVVRVQPLLPGSPAFGSAVVAACLPTDARGIARPAGGSCDSGAFEGVEPPANLGPAGMFGTFEVGSEVRCSPNRWRGDPAFTYRWLRNLSPIPGATAAKYVISPEDGGAVLQCEVRATNIAGAATSLSESVRIPVPRATPTPTVMPTPTPAVTPTPQSVKTCTVPRLVGRTLTSARKRLVSAGCGVGRITRKRSLAARRGKVLSSSPGAGKVVALGTKVRLTIGR